MTVSTILTEWTTDEGTRWEAITVKRADMNRAIKSARRGRGLFGAALRDAVDRSLVASGAPDWIVGAQRKSVSEGTQYAHVVQFGGAAVDRMLHNNR